MALPEPGTTSPGTLRIVYNNGTEVHTVGTHFTTGTDISDIAADRVIANDFATAVAGLLRSTNKVTAWRIVGPTGETLYEENFPVPLSGGVVTGGGDTVSASCSATFIGKGAPGTFGLKAGSIRTVVFLGYWRPAYVAPHVDQADIPGAADMLVFLNGNTAIGADFYGSKGTFKNSVDTQINAHWQQRIGF